MGTRSTKSEELKGAYKSTPTCSATVKLRDRLPVWPEFWHWCFSGVQATYLGGAGSSQEQLYRYWMSRRDELYTCWMIYPHGAYQTQG